MKLRNLILTFTVAISTCVVSAATTLEKGSWNITNSDDNLVTITHNGTEFLNGYMLQRLIALKTVQKPEKSTPQRCRLPQ